MRICLRPRRRVADPLPSMAHRRPAPICHPLRVRRLRSIRVQLRPAATQLPQAAPLADHIRHPPTVHPVRMVHQLDQPHSPLPATAHRLDQHHHRPLAMVHHQHAHMAHHHRGSSNHVVPRRATVHPRHRPHRKAMAHPHHQHHLPPGTAHPSRLPAAMAHHLVHPPAMEHPA